LAELLNGAAEMPLAGGVRDDKLADQLRSFDLATAAAPRLIRDADAAHACLAGLWLLANNLDRAHRISQNLNTPEGSFWHGIMHRREGDFANAKYWFHRVDNHPVFAVLTAAVGQVWDPFTFVDQVEARVMRGLGDEEKLIKWQRCEWDALFQHCLQLALGPI
jgi:hypothetical protein